VPIIVKTYIVWRVANPLEFYKSVGTSNVAAETKLYGQIKDTQNRVIGQHTFGEMVNSDPNLVRLSDIEQEMLTDLKKSVEKEYGIEVATLGIKQLKVSEDVTAKVFERMKAARNLTTRATIAMGAAEAKAIESDAKKKQEELLAAADARAMKIRGDGDAEAAQYYKMLEQEPNFALFLKDLDALKQMLRDKTTMLIPMDADPFKLLTQPPNPSQWKKKQ
jgi:membrane protease subunit HflC